MKRLVPSALSILMFLLAACAPSVITWRPSVASQVPDSTPVRFVRSGEQPTSGVALGWQSGQPRVINQRGEALVIPEDARLQVRLRKRQGNAPIGGLVGFVIGVGIAYDHCQAAGHVCENGDPAPLVGAAIGALIGATIRSYPWVTVKRDKP